MLNKRLVRRENLPAYEVTLGIEGMSVNTADLQKFLSSKGVILQYMDPTNSEKLVLTVSSFLPEKNLGSVFAEYGFEDISLNRKSAEGAESPQEVPEETVEATLEQKDGSKVQFSEFGNSSRFLGFAENSLNSGLFLGVAGYMGALRGVKEFAVNKLPEVNLSPESAKILRMVFQVYSTIKELGDAYRELTGEEMDFQFGVNGEIFVTINPSLPPQQLSKVYTLIESAKNSSTGIVILPMVESAGQETEEGSNVEAAEGEVAMSADLNAIACSVLPCGSGYDKYISKFHGEAADGEVACSQTSDDQGMEFSQYISQLRAGQKAGIRKDNQVAYSTEGEEEDPSEEDSVDDEGIDEDEDSGEDSTQEDDNSPEEFSNSGTKEILNPITYSCLAMNGFRAGYEELVPGQCEGKTSKEVSYSARSGEGISFGEFLLLSKTEDDHESDEEEPLEEDPADEEDKGDELDEESSQEVDDSREEGKQASFSALRRRKNPILEFCASGKDPGTGFSEYASGPKAKVRATVATPSGKSGGTVEAGIGEWVAWRKSQLSGGTKKKMGFDEFIIRRRGQDPGNQKGPPFMDPSQLQNPVQTKRSRVVAAPENHESFCDETPETQGKMAIGDSDILSKNKRFLAWLKAEGYPAEYALKIAKQVFSNPEEAEEKYPGIIRLVRSIDSNFSGKFPATADAVEAFSRKTGGFNGQQKPRNLYQALIGERNE